MSGYNNYVGKIAGNLEKSNMQMHMGTLNNDISPERKKALQNIIKYEFDVFIGLIFKTALGSSKKYANGELLHRYFQENERDLVPIFATMNEECLENPDFSKAIVSGEEYTKNIKERNYVLFSAPQNIESVNHEIVIKLLYVPSTSNDLPNRFRIDISEPIYMQSKYSILNYSVDIGDDGSITYNEPMITSEGITKPADKNQVHISFNPVNINRIRDVFIELFMKCGIKEDSEHIHK